MENNWTVYKHTNTKNGKVYIGITSQSIKRRWRNFGHGYKTNGYFYSAIKKYGWDSFSHEIILKNLSRDEAQNIEIKLILKYKSVNPNYGYNLTYGGEANVPSDETRLKMSESKIGKKATEETKEKFSKIFSGKGNPFYGKKHSEEAIAKMKLNCKVAKGEEHYMWGKHLSRERRESISKAHKGKPLSKEHCKKISKALTGIFRGENSTSARKVININTGRVFTTIQEAAKLFNIHQSGITRCCVGDAKSAGKDPKTKEKQKWMFYEDYINHQERGIVNAASKINE